MIKLVILICYLQKPIQKQDSNDNVLIIFTHMLCIPMLIFIYLYSYIYTSMFKSMNFTLNEWRITEHLTNLKFHL